VLDGDLALEVDGESHAAATGESVIFSADADHSYGNNGTRPLHVLMIVITPPAAKTITSGNDPRSGGAR
jgi:quercetin dioxygenase-like cupin family protein